MHACTNLLTNDRRREGIRKKFYNVLLYLDMMNLGPHTIGQHCLMGI